MRLIDADELIEKIHIHQKITKEQAIGEIRDDEVQYMLALHLAEEFIKTIPSAEPEQRWIPCSERLPDNEKRVLCTVQSGEHFCVVPCIFIQHTRRWLPEVYGNHDNVIAWMPLPEPYKGEPT